MVKTLSLFVGWLAVVLIVCIAPTCAQSNHASRTKVLKVLQRLSSDESAVVLSGQNFGHSNFNPSRAFAKNVQRLGRHTGRAPAILAVDYGYDGFPADFTQTNHLLRRHYQGRGLVTISMHPPNPWHNSESHDLRIGDLRELTTPGSIAHDRWRKTLDDVADGLLELKQLGVVVLWRPLHEMNGGWFWWGAHTKERWVDRREFIALWRDMHDYFTRQKGLDNLLWVYSAAVKKGDAEQSVVHFYPGDEFVDVVGLDWYDDALDALDEYSSYSQLVAKGKPLGLTEFGPQRQRDGSFNNRRLITAIAERYPNIGFFVFWHSWPGARVAIIDNAGSRALMLDPRVTTIDAQPK